MQFIDLQRQYQHYRKEINAAIQEVLDSSMYIMGPQVNQIETLLAEAVGVKHCLAVSSGTDSLLLALMALGIKPGDEVITVPFTFIATLEVISLLGAKPVLVDIEPQTYNIDITQIEQAITPKTKAIMPVSLFGQMPDYSAINAIAKRYNLPVIEDGAQSFGATQYGKPSCGLTTIASTSFFPAKPFACYGDGGALFTDDDELAEKMASIRSHGSSKRYYHDQLGINARFDSIQAAVLLAKWPHFAEEVQLRQEIGRRYTELLKDVCETPIIEEGNTHIYAEYTIRHPMRDELARELKKHGIPTAIYYPKCAHEQIAYKDLGYSKGSFPVSEQAADEVISLPMHPWLTIEEQDLIVEKVKASSLVLA
jgi:UDP-2-acetamido-2-deoxy-ribo-hexuluronate aminotransferase